MVYQLATQDPMFLKHVRSKTKDYVRSDVEDTAKLWRELVLDYAKSNLRAVFFMVVDGLSTTELGSENVLWSILMDTFSSSSDSEGLHQSQGDRMRSVACGRREVVSSKALNSCQLSKASLSVKTISRNLSPHRSME